VPRDGNSGEDVVRDVVELGTIFIQHDEAFRLSAHLTVTSRPGELGGGDAGAT
jgi:hypothetical protein